MATEPGTNTTAFSATDSPVDIWLGETGWLELTELALACEVAPQTIHRLVEEGLLEPALTEPTWRFGSDELARLRRILRLQRDFEASLPSVGVMLDLLAEIERLRGLLLRAGLRG
jgi:chaperone modulatory protein CbpM